MCHPFSALLAYKRANRMLYHLLRGILQTIVLHIMMSESQPCSPAVGILVKGKQINTGIQGIAWLAACSAATAAAAAIAVAPDAIAAAVVGLVEGGAPVLKHQLSSSCVVYAVEISSSLKRRNIVIPSSMHKLLAFH
jgi:hypothetical protein